MPVMELQKPAMQWCEHCEIGKGCRVYATKPPSCNDFECLWLVNEWMPEEFRPDRCKVVFEGLHGANIALAMPNEGMTSAHLRGPVFRLIKMMVTRFGYSILVLRHSKSEEPIIFPARGVTVEDIARDIERIGDQNMERYAAQHGLTLEQALTQEDAFRSATKVRITVPEGS